jgi:hypothetical protein
MQTVLALAGPLGARYESTKGSRSPARHLAERSDRAGWLSDLSVGYGVVVVGEAVPMMSASRLAKMFIASLKPFGSAAGSCVMA